MNDSCFYMQIYAFTLTRTTKVRNSTLQTTWAEITIMRPGQRKTREADRREASPHPTTTTQLALSFPLALPSAPFPHLTGVRGITPSIILELKMLLREFQGILDININPLFTRIFNSKFCNSPEVPYFCPPPKISVTCSASYGVSVLLQQRRI